MHDRDRKRKEFKAALALAGQTADEWAASHGVTASHVYMVLTGRRESASLTAKAEAFIAEQLAQYSQNEQHAA